MDYAFPTYTKFKFCITGPCFRYKTILFDYSIGDSLLHPAACAASCLQKTLHQQDMVGRAAGTPVAQCAREAGESICCNYVNCRVSSPVPSSSRRSNQ